MPAQRALGIGVAFAPVPEVARDALGLERGGATLVRPDGHIAWRSVARASAPERALLEALRRSAHAVAS